MSRRPTYSRLLKWAMLRKLRNGTSAVEISRTYGVSCCTLYEWCKDWNGGK